MLVFGVFFLRGWKGCEINCARIEGEGSVHLVDVGGRTGTKRNEEKRLEDRRPGEGQNILKRHSFSLVPSFPS